MNSLARNSWLLAILLLPCTLSFSQPGETPQFVQLVSDQNLQLKAGTATTLQLRFEITEGYHIQSDNPEDENLIPTELTFDRIEGLTFESTDYPQAIDFFLEGVEEPLKVFDHVFDITVSVNTAQDIKSDTYSITGELYYQACNDRTCLYPRGLPISMTANIQ